MMVQQNRRERRNGGRQAKSGYILLAVVALVCFGAGYMAGSNSASSRPAPAVVTATPQPKPQPMPKPATDGAVVEEKVAAENLTFFDSLPKGEQPPLGSGINVPKAGDDPVAAKIDQQTAKAAPVPVPAPTAPVAAPAKPAATKPVATAPSKPEPHVLQISSFKSPDEAGILMRRLEKKGYQPYIQQADLGSKGVWYRVFLGPYPSKDKAQTAANKLKSEEKLDSLLRRQ